MIAELKEILVLLEEIPNGIVNVLIGFGVYKLLIYLSTTAGIYGLLRLAINKIFEYNMNELNHRKDELHLRMLQWGERTGRPPEEYSSAGFGGKKV